MITDNQKKVVKMIEENLDICFEGNTFTDAKKFISEHIDESKRISDYYKELLISNYGGYKKIWELLK